MNQDLQNLFNHLHTLIGFDTQQSRDEAVQKLEQATVLKSMECCIKSLQAEDKKQFDRMMRETPQPTSDAITKFFQTKLSAARIEQCFKEATKQVVRQYMTTLLTMLTEEQKTSISNDFLGILKKTDPKVLSEVMREAQLSTDAH